MTEAGLLDELRNRLGAHDTAVWSDADLYGFLDFAIKSLYPTFYQLNAGVTVAGSGPVQTPPSGAKHFYMISTLSENGRLRPIRDWLESSNGDTIIPLPAMNGKTLVWAWTSGYTPPAGHTDPLTFEPHAEEVVILRAQVTALQKVLSNRSAYDKYFAQQVRPSATEQDIALTIEQLHTAIDERLKYAVPLPQVVK